MTSLLNYKNISIRSEIDGWGGGGQTDRMVISLAYMFSLWRKVGYKNSFNDICDPPECSPRPTFGSRPIGWEPLVYVLQGGGQRQYGIAYRGKAWWRLHGPQGHYGSNNNEDPTITRKKTCSGDVRKGLASRWWIRQYICTHMHAYILLL
jgi:hypothetical protein